MKIGDLVMVRKSALSDRAEHCDLNRSVVERHGWLWVVELDDDNEDDPDENLWLCRALATGEEQVWFAREVEEKDNQS